MTKVRLSDEELARYFEDDFEPGEMRDRSATAEIEEAVHARQRAEDAVEAAVIRARRAGLTWVEIASGLGVSHQAAMKRYRDKV
ncbi:MAG: hypothetical protein J2P26_08490 [Nocardiopsaceae bacterium]|nr:hypothetical protein [Nocardiopsaceae bacterium]